MGLYHKHQPPNSLTSIVVCHFYYFSESSKLSIIVQQQLIIFPLNFCLEISYHIWYQLRTRGIRISHLCMCISPHEDVCLNGPLGQSMQGVIHLASWYMGERLNSNLPRYYIDWDICLRTCCIASNQWFPLHSFIHMILPMYTNRRLAVEAINAHSLPHCVGDTKNTTLTVN